MPRWDLSPDCWARVCFARQKGSATRFSATPCTTRGRDEYQRWRHVQCTAKIQTRMFMPMSALPTRFSAIPGTTVDLRATIQGLHVSVIKRILMMIMSATTGRDLRRHPLQHFRPLAVPGGLVFKAQTFVSRSSRLESNKAEEEQQFSHLLATKRMECCRSTDPAGFSGEINSM